MDLVLGVGDVLAQKVLQPVEPCAQQPSTSAVAACQNHPRKAVDAARTGLEVALGDGLFLLVLHPLDLAPQLCHLAAHRTT